MSSAIEYTLEIKTQKLRNHFIFKCESALIKVQKCKYFDNIKFYLFYDNKIYKRMTNKKATPY